MRTTLPPQQRKPSPNAHPLPPLIVLSPWKKRVLAAIGSSIPPAREKNDPSSGDREPRALLDPTVLHVEHALAARGDALVVRDEEQREVALFLLAQQEIEHARAGRG